ncbi:hypothetical protein ALC57_05703, partial [Trachymyrmex cornetzi]
GVGGSNDASKGQQVAIRAYCFELLIANSCDRPTEKRSGKNVVPYGLHPPSYNAWSSSCAFYPRNYEGKIKHRHSRREFRLPSNKGVHERAEGNPGGPSRTKAVAAVIIVDVDADWASPSFQLTKQPSETKVPDGRLGFPSFWKLSVWTRSP